MKKIVFLSLLLLSMGQAKATLIKYVSHEMIGKGTGKSAKDAADFLDAKFWEEVKLTLTKEGVVVKFLAGDYSRAYTEKPLLIHNMGHEKNQLVLEGVTGSTIFTAPMGHKEKAVMFEIKDAQNIIVKNFSFTGNGKIGYVLRITSSKDKTTKNILVENCNWSDMRGVIYGTTGCHKPGTSDVTYKNCVFKRVGIDSHSHHMYHAHGATRINVLDSHFEDSTGDYVRFRDNCNYITVKGSTFVRNENFPVYPFVSIPLFNNIDPGDERFSSHFTVTGNSFTNGKYAVAFHNYGYNFPGFNYLLTASEGAILQSGNAEAQKQLMNSHFGIDAGKIIVKDNKYNKVTTKVGLGTFARYGAPSKGFNGWGDISGLFE